MVAALQDRFAVTVERARRAVPLLWEPGLVVVNPCFADAGCWVMRLGDWDALYAGEHFVEGLCVAGLVEEEDEFEILDVNALDGVGAWAGSVANEDGAVAFVGS